MLLLVIVLLTLVLCVLLRLLRPRPAQINKPAESKPTALQKLVSEAFEHATLSPPSAPRILVLYGTEYGFAKEVASRLAASLAAAGFAPRVVSALHYRVVDFTKELFLAFICSTTGDGAPPNEATDLRDALVAKDVVLPPNCRFAVLALGDRAYPHFCRAGVEFDQLFGDARLLDRVDIDQEDWVVINDWITTFENVVKKKLQERAPQSDESDCDDYLEAAMGKYVKTLEKCADARYTRNDPFLATVADQYLLTAPKTGHADDKEVIRVEFDIAGSGIQYKCGDALGVVPKNNPQHVDRLLRAMASNGDELVWVSDKADPVSFATALTEQLDLRTVKPELVLALAQKSTYDTELALAERVLGHKLSEITQPAASLSEWGKIYLAEREVLDVVGDFVSATMTPQGLAELLRPLHARYYSISSTPVLSPERIAVTVDVLRYRSLNIEREGVASTFLKNRCRVNETEVGVFISKNSNFRLPVDGDRPIIMIGPGTGIAPFIGFIEQRLEEKASGQNWLFFGCRHEKQDFLYGEQLREYDENEKIVLRTAFSRDTANKIYVQHRLTECGGELWRLIDDQMAHVYVCGDGGRMADDVDLALRGIVQDKGEKSLDETERFMKELADSSRYQRDVWVA